MLEPGATFVVLAQAHNTASLRFHAGQGHSWARNVLSVLLGRGERRDGTSRKQEVHPNRPRKEGWGAANPGTGIAPCQPRPRSLCRGMRRFVPLMLAWAASTGTAQTTTLNEVTQALHRAQRQVIAYLPDLQAQMLAQALKEAASRRVHVYLITPRHAHLRPGSFLPSVALANAEQPPLPLGYHFGELNAPPLIIVDNRTLYLGAGLADGSSTVRRGTSAELTRALTASANVINASPNVPARVLIKERYGLAW